MAMEEDFSEFLDEDEFADAGVFTSGASVPAYQPRNVTGIFDAAFVDARIRATNLETTEPKFLCKETDTVGIARGDTAAIKGKTFDVVQVQPDGTGMAVIILSET